MKEFSFKKKTRQWKQQLKCFFNVAHADDLLRQDKATLVQAKYNTYNTNTLTAMQTIIPGQSYSSATVDPLAIITMATSTQMDQLREGLKSTDSILQTVIKQQQQHDGVSNPTADTVYITRTPNKEQQAALDIVKDYLLPQQSQHH